MGKILNIYKKLVGKINPVSLINDSVLFDADYYFNSYGIKKEEAAKHYYEIGWKKGYNPSAIFNNDDYLLFNEDINNINPLLHYELYGRDEKRKLRLSKKYYLNDILKYYTNSPIKYKTGKSVSVIIPIYNAYELLSMALESVLNNTKDDVKVYLVDDASTDNRVKELLDKYVNNKNWYVINNDTNLGFVKSVNKAMQNIDTDIAILLNSDTKVPKNWVEKLTAPYYDFDNVATTTPFTNSGVFFSFPVFKENNEMTYDLEKINAVLDKVQSLNENIDNIYSGNGFCISINMKAWKEIGQLDEAHFEKGYGEENEWCFRAYNAGYTHKLIPNLFVEHRHGGSFASEEKKTLMARHHNYLIEQYPIISNKLFPAYINEDPWKRYRCLISLLLSSNKTALIIDIDLPTNSISGANSYIALKNKELEKEGYEIVSLRYKTRSNDWTLYPTSISESNQVSLNSFSDIKNLFSLLNVSLVFINNFAYNTEVEENINIICSLKEKYDFKLIYPFHDHLSICPSFFLIDSDVKPCKLPNIESCNKCLAKNVRLTVQRDNIVRWRQSFKKLFDYCDEFIFFSNYTKNIICKVYEKCEKGKVIYHNPVINDTSCKYTKKNNDVLKMGFVGNYCIEKGSIYFNNLINRLKRERSVDALIIGYSGEDTPFRTTGKYDVDNLGKIIQEEKIDFVVYPSIANETFSYVVQELMTLEVPIVSFTCGGHAERLKDYYCTELADEVNEESLYNATIRMINRLQ